MKTKKLLVVSVLMTVLCFISAFFMSLPVIADTTTTDMGGKNIWFYNTSPASNSNAERDWNGVNISSFDALSVNFPSSNTSGALVSIKFPFESADLTETNGAIRIRMETLVVTSANQALRFDLVGASTTYMTTGSTLYRVENGVSTTLTSTGSGTGAAVNVVSSGKLIDGYLIIPMSTWNVTANAITGLTVRTNYIYAKNVWNFGEIEFGTYENGAFTSSKSLWTAYDNNGNANSYTVDMGASNASVMLVKANTINGVTKNPWLKTAFNTTASTIDISKYDGIKLYVDNSNSTQNKSIQVLMHSTETAVADIKPATSWMSKNGLAYFTPDSDCTAFKNSFAYRSSFAPAGFKGEIFIPFNTTADGKFGAFQVYSNSTPTTFPTTIHNQLMIYASVVSGEALGFKNLGLVADATSFMSKAFGTTASVNLAIDDEKALMIQQTENTVGTKYELQPANKGNVAFSTVTDAGVTSGGSAIAMSIENLNSEPFKLRLTSYNSANDLVVLGGQAGASKVTFTKPNGEVEKLDCQDGYVLVPAFAKGTITLSYVGGTSTPLSNCTNIWGYPTGAIFRIYFETVKTTGAKLPVDYLVGDIAIVNNNGTHTVLTVNGTSVINLATSDTNYRIERSNIAYSGVLKYVNANVTENDLATVSVDKSNVRYNGEVTYTVEGLNGANYLESATLNGEDVTEDLVLENGVYTYTTRIKQDATFAISTFVDSLAVNSQNFFYEGASIRTQVVDGLSNGIRFSVLMTKSLYNSIIANENANPIFGTLIIPEDMKGEQLTVDTLNVNNTVTNDVLTEVTIDNVEYIRWIVCIFDIPEYSYSRGFAVRGYVNIDGTYIYTEEQEARSLASVAQAVWSKNDVAQSVKDAVKVYLPTLSYDLADAQGEVESTTLYNGVTYTLPSIDDLGVTAPEGKTFKGYSVYGKEYSAGQTITISGNVTISIIWEVI